MAESIDTLFFELLRVAIGTQEALSRQPNADEWEELYKMAKKQSLVGICFAGVQKTIYCSALKGEDVSAIGMSEKLYLTWLGKTTKIKQRNLVVDQQCVELQKRLSADGLKSSILKGQGVAQLYAGHLRGLRQSGDIDVYVNCGMEKALAYAKEKYGDIEYDYINAHVPVFKDTEVELHWRVQALTNVFANRKLQNWLNEHQNEVFSGKEWLEVKGERWEIVTPSVEFNAFYILLHCYHHLLESGLGLRQLMDYYWILYNTPTKGEELKYSDAAKAIAQFGMKKFATGVMWIMKEVFGLPEEKMLCEANETEGEFLLHEVMQSGNFGHYDERIKKIGTGKMMSIMNELQHSLSVASHYPSIVFWRPVWIVYHFLWKRLKKYKQNS
ncbi:MAG: nucleotidyltransferase family protein [Paludibacteraceae bacterium]|nr:nucleotidyltransferase family protein [Paludibacteraceae bacterium]